MTTRTMIIFGVVGLLLGLLGSILLRDFQEHGSRLLWVGYLFPAALAISGVASAGIRNRLLPKFASRRLLLLLLFQWPATLLATFGAFFGFASVLPKFSFFWAWFCYAVALLVFAGFVYFMGREVENDGRNGLVWLLIANALTFVALVLGYKTILLPNTQSADVPTGVFFGFIFGPLSALNAAWVGWKVARAYGSDRGYDVK